MGIRITGDKRECRVLVKDKYEIGRAREQIDEICRSERSVMMPDDFVRNNLGYEMVFRNRHSLKEFICFDGFGEDNFRSFLWAMADIFKTAEKNGIDPYSFVFDISCVFVENNGRDFYFVYTPDCVTEVNNGCGDLISLVSLYSGFETDSPEEKSMRRAMEILREWERDRFENHNVRYDFPLGQIGVAGVEKKKKEGRMICLTREKPFLMIFSSGKNDGYVCRIGRDDSWANVKEGSLLTSRRHAEITYDDNAFMFRDLGSTNGSVMNGMKCLPQKKYRMKGFNKIVVGTDKRLIFLCI
jgi:hypothetical protein